MNDMNTTTAPGDWIDRLGALADRYGDMRIMASRDRATRADVTEARNEMLAHARQRPTEGAAPASDARAAGVPEGYALVPLEPTQAMLEAVRTHRPHPTARKPDHWDSTHAAIYRRMVAATAPKAAPEAMEVQAVAWEYANSHGNKFLTHTDPSKWHPHDQAGFKDFRPLVYTSPAVAPSVQPVRMTDDEIDTFYEEWEFNEADPGRSEFHSLVREVESRTIGAPPSAAPAAIGEPPLIGNWHHGQGYLVSGTIRISRWDCDTNPPVEFRDKMLDWMCNTLNAAVKAWEDGAPDEFAAQYESWDRQSKLACQPVTPDEHPAEDANRG